MYSIINVAYYHRVIMNLQYIEFFYDFISIVEISNRIDFSFSKLNKPIYCVLYNNII